MPVGSQVAGQQLLLGVGPQLLWTLEQSGAPLPQMPLGL